MLQGGVKVVGEFLAIRALLVVMVEKLVSGPLEDSLHGRIVRGLSRDRGRRPSVGARSAAPRDIWSILVPLPKPAWAEGLTTLQNCNAVS